MRNRNDYFTPASAKRYHNRLVQMKMRKPLSAACSEVRKLARERAAAHDDIRAFGAPSECYDDVRRSYERALLEIVKRHGFLNVEIFYDVVVARTSGKWAHFNLGI